MPSEVIRVEHEDETVELVEVPMVTSNWKTIAKLVESDRPLDLTPVRTSVGVPRHFGQWAKNCPLANELAPWGLTKVANKRTFERKYRARLEENGVIKIHEHLTQIYLEGGERTLALLCYEDLAKAWCHRRTFAKWWEQQTGQKVPEFKP